MDISTTQTSTKIAALNFNNRVLWKVFSPKETLLNDLMFQGLMLIQVASSQAHYQLVANPIL
eukprot:CCRYP_000349-RC/>CCRYP_000349-RC protein AED:0.30 eAED:0.39 QI:750/0.33/0.75/1/0/0/4/0/61